MYLFLALRLRPFAQLLSAVLLFIGLNYSAALAQQLPDEPLQQALNEYIALSQANNVDAANTLLSDLYQRYYIDPQAQSTLAAKVRLMAYQARHLLVAKQMPQANTLLSALLALGETTDSSDILTEIYATEIEFLMQNKEISAAIIKADRLELHAMQTREPRLRYYAHSLLGQLFKQDDQYEQSLQQFTRALDAVIATDDQFTLYRRSSLNYQIALVYSSLKKWPEAKALIEEVIADVQKYQYNRFLPQLYLALGFIVAEQKDYENAIAANKLGIAAAQETDNPRSELTFQNNLGSIYMEQGNFTAAKKVLETAAKQAEALNDEYNRQLIAFNLAYIEVMNGKHDSGLTKMRAALEYFRINDTKAVFESTLTWLAKAYAAAGKYQLQAQTLEQQLEMRAEILTSEREKSVAELQNRYDTKAKSQLITILEQENNLKAQLLDNQKLQQQITAMFTLVLIFAAVMLYQLYRKVRQSNRKLREANKQLEFQSLRDPLTGLFNRRALQEQMQRREKYGRRQSDSSPNANGFLLLDIDYFKKINDNYGHAAGDEVLTQLSARLSKVCRDEDLVIRWGGEEFLLYLEHIAPEQVSGFCQRILDVIASEPVQCDGKLIAVSASGGFIHLPFANIDETDLNWERALQIADMALYLGKVNGRNQVYAITGLRCDYEAAREPLTNDLQGAIRQNMVDYITIKGPTLPS